MKKVIFGCFIVLVMISGCSDPVEQTGEDPKIEEFEKMLNQGFSGPDEELAGIFEKLTSDDFQQTSEGFKALGAYQKERYGDFFTDEYYIEIVNRNMLFTFFQERAYLKGLQLNAEAVTVKVSESNAQAYDFSVDVHTGEEDITVEGRINTNNIGKITRIRYTKGMEWL